MYPGMPSWKEIKDYARSKYKLAEDEERYFSLRLPDEDQLGEAERRVALAVRERA